MLSRGLFAVALKLRSSPGRLGAVVRSGAKGTLAMGRGVGGDSRAILATPGRLHPGRGKVLKIVGLPFRSYHDDAHFVIEDGQKTETQSANVLSGVSGLLLTGAPKAQRPDFGSVVDMRAKFSAQMLSLHPGRGGFPEIAECYTQAAHDTAIAARRVECKKKGLKFHLDQVKVSFVNEDGQETTTQSGSVWSGNSALSTAGMKETANARIRTTQMAARPKGSNAQSILERAATDKLAQMAGASVTHLEEGRLFDFAINEPDAEGNVVYAQTAVLRMKTASGTVKSNKSIGKIKQYLRGGGAVFFLVMIDNEITRAYVLLPSDLPWFEEATSEMKQSTEFQPSPYAKIKGSGLGKVMRNLFRLEPSELESKVRKHISTGPRKPLAFLNGDPSQMSAGKMIEHEYLNPFMVKFSGIASRIVNQAGDLKICGVSAEFKKARLTWDSTKSYRGRIRGNAGLVTDFNEVRAFCFVVETAPQKLVYIFVPSLTAGGTCSFAPKGGGDAHRLALCFYFDGAQFSANPGQYDESCLADVLIVEDLEVPGVEEQIVAFMKLCEARPAMSPEEQQRASHIPKGVKEREQDARSEKQRVRRAKRLKALDNHKVNKE